MNRWSVRAALALAVRHVAEGKGLPQGDRRAGITQYESTQRRQPNASAHLAPTYIRGMQSLLLALALALSHAPTDSLPQVIRARIAQVPGAQVGLAFRRLDGTDSLYIESDTEFHAASTMKVPVMIELFRQIDAHELSLDQLVPVANEFKSIVDSSAYTLDPGDDSDSAMYKLVGSRVSVRDLMDHMIERSSNLATNTLIALAGAQRTTQTMRELGATHTHVLRGVEDDKAFDRGMNNMISARDLATILDAIQTNRAASASSCAMMRDILLHQEFSAEIPAGLPPGTPVAHKTGWINRSSPRCRDRVSARGAGVHPRRPNARHSRRDRRAIAHRRHLARRVRACRRVRVEHERRVALTSGPPGSRAPLAPHRTIRCSPQRSLATECASRSPG